MNEFANEINDKLQGTVLKLNNIFGVEMPLPPVIMNPDLKKTAGRNTWFTKIELNPNYFKKYHRDMIDQTLPHEVCHSFSRYYYCHLKRMEIKSHGKEWKNLMRLLKLEPKRCHNYDVEESGATLRNRTRYSFTCDCGAKFVLSSNRYNSMVKNPVKTWCRRCKTVIPLSAWQKYETRPQAAQTIITPTQFNVNDIDLGDEFGMD
jgi:predicted SprT family Zn-dependent metalloprotease